MNLRLTSWWALALLLFTANFGIAVSRVAPLREPSAIVFVDGTTDESRDEVEQHSSGIPQAQSAARKAVFIAVSHAAWTHAPLFERPPPVFAFLS